MFLILIWPATVVYCIGLAICSSGGKAVPTEVSLRTYCYGLTHMMLSCKRFVKPLLAADAMLVSSEKLGDLLRAGHTLSF